MPNAVPEAAGSPKVNILMVDDSADKLLAMESVLAALGQNLIKVRSGEEALRLLLKKDFAVILLDVNMPGMDGFETAAMIRQRRSLQHIPIIFVTALSTTDSDVFKGYSFGAVDYVLTPIVPEILRIKVGVFVDLWKQRYELQQQAETLRVLNEDLKTRAEQLTLANRELESFCYTIAHDLRAPLRAMEGMTSVLLDDYKDKLDAEAREYGDRIRQAAARMDQMIQELLSYSRLTLMEFQPQPIRLSRVIKEVLGQLGWELEQKKAILRIRRCTSQVLGHYAVLVQVIANLVTNAVKFVAPGIQPIIKIREERRGDYVRVWVEDNGIGIAPEHQKRIFRIFERLHGRETYSGTGIGLAIVEKAIHRMKGRVGVESEPDKGSRFWIELPVYEPEKAEVDIGKEPNFAAIGSGNGPEHVPAQRSGGSELLRLNPKEIGGSAS
jgi:two-component system sensor histidine kinase/response regulator